MALNLIKSFRMDLKIKYLFLLGISSCKHHSEESSFMSSSNVIWKVICISTDFLALITVR